MLEITFMNKNQTFQTHLNGNNYKFVIQSEKLLLKNKWP